MRMPHTRFRHRLAGLVLVLAALPVHTMAQHTAGTCSYTGAPDWAGPAPIVEHACTDWDTPMATCSDVRVRFHNGVARTAEEIGVPRMNGDMQFVPAGMAFVEETVGGDGYPRWRLYLIEPGGGRAAQERWMMFDGEGKLLSTLMNAQQMAAWTAERHQPNEALSVEEPVFLKASCTP